MAEKTSSNLSKPTSESENLEAFDLFIRSLTHRLKNQLGLARIQLRDSIYGFEKPDSQDIGSLKERLIEIERGIGEAIALVARVQEAQRPLKVERCDLNMLLDSVLKTQSFPDNVKVRIHREETGELPVLGNEQLSEVFLNLVENAVAAMPDGGTIDIHLRTVNTPEGKKFELRVLDTGTGIPEQLRNRLFKEILGGARTGNHGTGLWLSKRLLQWLGGDIKLLETEIGRGTTFLVTIPLVHDRPGREMDG